MSQGIEIVANSKGVDLGHLVNTLRDNGYEVVSKRSARTLEIRPSGSSAPKRRS